MKIKLYKKWRAIALKEYKRSDIDSQDPWHVSGERMYLKQLNGSRSSIVFFHEVALTIMKYNYNTWLSFKHKYRKYSKKYWEPEAILKRIIATGKED